MSVFAPVIFVFGKNIKKRRKKSKTDNFKTEKPRHYIQMVCLLFGLTENERTVT